MKRHTLIIAIMASALLQCAFPSSAANEIPKHEIEILNDAITNAPLYTGAKQRSIDSLTLRLRRIPPSRPVERFRLHIAISDAYRSFNTDSALTYVYGATNILRQPEVTTLPEYDDLQIKAQVTLLNALATAGIFATAEDIYNSLKTADLTPPQKIEFWRSARLLFSYMQAYVERSSHFYDDYSRQYIACDDSLLKVLPHSDRFYRFIYAERLVRDGKYSEAETQLLGMVNSLPESSNLYGMAAFQLAEVYLNRGNNNLYATFLAKAATSDIKGAVREGLALPTLAQWLYNQGDTYEAFRFINFAMAEANAGNARMRSVAIASLMPVIDSAYREQISKANVWLTTSVVIIAILFILSLFLLIMLYRYIRRTHAINARLRTTFKTLESYIGHFIALCANYADKLDALNSLVSRKIASGQSDELLKMVKSGKFTDTQNDEFYAIFDTAFLEIYPDFIEEINGLLQPDKQFKNIEKGSLTPELRIYALVRLGLAESTRISQVLHYSVSTIYAYRNRMRNRAVTRDTFETDVLHICGQQDKRSTGGMSFELLKS